MGDGNAKLRFYAPLPAFGVKMSRQWPKFREDFESLAPLVRATYVDLAPSSEHNPVENNVSGWSVGESSFFNRFRSWYDKANDRFTIQYNSGTEAIEIWNDYLTIRQSDGRVTIPGSGGLDSSAGGFYPGVFTVPVSGGFYGIIVKDGTRTYQRKDIINFSGNDFYITDGTGHTPVINLKNHPSFTDGRVTYLSDTLGFNNNQFYLSSGSQGKAVVNISAGYAPNGCVTMIRSADSNNLTTVSAAWIVSNEHGERIGTAGSTSEGLQEAITYAAYNGFDLKVYGGGIATKNGQDVAIINCTNQITVPPVQGVRWDIHATINFGGSPSGTPAGILFDSIMASDICFRDQIVVTSPYTYGVRFAPSQELPQDPAGPVITSSTIKLGSVVKTTGIGIDLDCTNGGISSNFFEFTEPNGGTTAGVRVTPGVSTSFDHNDIRIIDCHAQDTGINAGFSNALGTNCFGNIWHVQCDPLTGGVGVEIFGHNESWNIAVTNLEGTPANGITLNNSANKNVIILRNDNATNSVNDVSTTADNIIIAPSGSGTINFGTQRLTNLGAPTAASDAARLQDVGPGFYGVVWSDSVVTKRTDRLSFNNSEFYLDGRKPTLNIKESGISHSLLGNLAADDHTQYVRVDGTRAFTGSQSMGSNKLTSVTDPTAAQDAATKNYVDTAVGPGFYGIFVRESDGNPPTYRKDTIIFDSSSFYLNSDSTGKPIVSLRGSAAGAAGLSSINFSESDGNPPTFATDTLIFNSLDFYLAANSAGKPTVNLRGVPGPLSKDFGLSAEWQFQHNLNTSKLIWSAYDNRQRAIIPDTVDVSDPNTAYFYLNPALAGTVVLGGVVNSSPPIINFTDGTRSVLASKVNFNANQFYLSQQGDSSPVVNLRNGFIKGLALEFPGAAENALIFFAPRAMVIQSATAVLVGSASPSVTFAVKSGTNRSSLGVTHTTSVAVTNTTTGTGLSVSTPAIPANSWVCLVSTAQSGTVTELDLDLEVE